MKMRVETPLLWVIDGLDEADTPSVLISSLARFASNMPIRLFISSRPMKMALNTTGFPLLNTILINEAITARDIRYFVRRSVEEFLPNDDSICEDVANQIISKAQTSKMWDPPRQRKRRTSCKTPRSMQKIL